MVERSHDRQPGSDAPGRAAFARRYGEPAPGVTSNGATAANGIDACRHTAPSDPGRCSNRPAGASAARTERPPSWDSSPRHWNRGWPSSGSNASVKKRLKNASVEKRLRSSLAVPERQKRLRSSLASRNNASTNERYFGNFPEGMGASGHRLHSGSRRRSRNCRQLRAFRELLRNSSLWHESCNI